MQVRDDERGEILPLLILWPAIIVLLLMLAAQAFLVTGARAHAEAAASAGLRAAWAAVGDAGLAHADGSLYPGTGPHPATALMTEAAHDAVAHMAAGDSAGWRWWTSGASVVSSDWCHSGAQAGNRPGAGEPGWIRVEVSGDVIGPFSALWPGRLDTVHAAAVGPAVLTVTNGSQESAEAGTGLMPSIPVSLPEC
ncbi:hypothetical protein F4X33_20335 [Candidatus Poribacteria bacterium]|nr:hypothetical protein [Chloroflexota bacterium]MYE91336.1 hypothetical protein [Candidatus Poribacteria bacterium]